MRLNRGAPLCALVSATLLLGAASRCSGEEATSGIGVAETADARSEAERRINETLRHPLKAPLDFVDTPLNQIMAVISDDYEIPILFDVPSIEAVACSPDVKVTFSVGNVSLRSALDLMLQIAASDLTYVIDKEVLMITTDEEAEKRLQVRVYRVDDLQIPKVPNLAGASAYADFDSLIDLIVSNVERDSWHENGTGEGEINPHGRGIVVISQTPLVHEQVERLLDDLRRNMTAVEKDKAANAAESSDRLVTWGIRVSDELLAEPPQTKAAIVEILRTAVDWDAEDDEYDEGEVFLTLEGSRIYVRHRPELLQKVEEAMEEMGVGSHLSHPVASGAFGGENRNPAPKRGGF